MSLPTLAATLASLSLFIKTIGYAFPRTVDQLDSLASDIVEFWRFRNKVIILEKAKKLIDDKGMSSKAIPKNFLIPLLEEAQNTDEHELQEMWAALLANAAIGEAVHPSYIKIIREITVVEAKILNNLFIKYQVSADKIFNKRNFIDDIKKQIQEIKTLSEVTIELKSNVIFGNLQRLGLIGIDTKRRIINDNLSSNLGGGGVQNFQPRELVYENIRLEDFAIDFLQSCLQISSNNGYQ